MFDRLINVALGKQGSKLCMGFLIVSLVFWYADYPKLGAVFGGIALGIAALNYGYELGRDGR